MMRFGKELTLMINKRSIWNCLNSWKTFCRSFSLTTTSWVFRTKSLKSVPILQIKKSNAILKSQIRILKKGECHLRMASGTFLEGATVAPSFWKFADLPNYGLAVSANWPKWCTMRSLKMSWDIIRPSWFGLRRWTSTKTRRILKIRRRSCAR